jgi:hypothetical protein
MTLEERLFAALYASVGATLFALVLALAALTLAV